jgi:ubiquinone/menaquinone biosynthesis C-methylase UbiE
MFMTAAQNSTPQWVSSFRLVAAEKWKAKSAAMGRDVTNALVDYARPEPGMKVLDLASGTGEPAITIASRIGPSGQVTALDLSAELLEIAADRARQRSLTNISIQHADAHHLPFPDASFDLVTSRFGVMFFEDGVRALCEARRVLKPGARACFLAWGPFRQPYWQSTMGVVVKHVGGPALAPGGPDPFKFSQPGSLSSALRQAGFREVEEQTKEVPWTWPGTAEEVWEQARAASTPFLPLLERVPAGKWDEINGEIYRAINRYREGDSIKFGALIVLASGKKN